VRVTLLQRTTRSSADDVERHHVGRIALRVHDFRARVGFHSLSDDMVRRQQELELVGLRLLKEFPGKRNLVLFDSDLPTASPALSGRCRPCAADDQHVHLAEQVLDDAICRSPWPAKSATNGRSGF